MIHPILKRKMIRSDPERWAKLSQVLSNGFDMNSNWSLNKVSDNIFGMSFKHNWSIRNYKVGAGMTLALDLKDKGYSDDEIRWISRTIGEAYKAQAHLAGAQDITGDKPYFVMDAAAHEVGADFALHFSRGMSPETYVRDRYPDARREAEANAEADWEKVKRAHDLMQSGKSFKELFQ
jgi:hypothetical protein